MTSIRLCLLLGVMGCAAMPASAQQPPVSDRDVVSVDAGIAAVSDYMFRGVRQNSSGVALWPFGDLSLTAYSGDRPLQRIDARFGFWNSLNTGDTGSDGLSGRAWYESRLVGGLELRFGKGVSVATSYTAYTSPNDLFTSAKELGVRLGLDQGPQLGSVGLNPYALVAIELGTEPGIGQLDGGQNGGKYLELGVSPGYSAGRVTIASPVKVGLSLHDYYELGGEDHTFGFASIGATVAVPLGRTSKLGRLGVHGGVEFQRLGETTRMFNGGDRAKVIASLGVGIIR
jgi:hypothetical protein